MALPSVRIPKQEMEELLPMRSFWWLLESAPDGVVIVNGEGRVMLANTQAERMFGWTEDELLDKPIEVLVPERFRQKHIQHRAEYAAEPRTRPMGIGLELFGVRRDGAEFPVEISLSPVETKKGLLVMAIIRDISEHKREHFISHTLQNALFSPLPDELGGLTIASAYRSAYAGALVGGDFLDVFALGPRTIGISIGDVSGKGVEASVYTALVKYSLRAYAYEDTSASVALERVNRAVCRQLGPDAFITMLYGVLDLENGAFSFANAGHMPPLYLDSASHEVTELVRYGLPLGVQPDTRYEGRLAELKSGDRMLLYTDGVTEARGQDWLYGLDRLIEFVRGNGSEPSDDFIAHLMRTLDDWSRGRLRDDIAALLISMK